MGKKIGGIRLIFIELLITPLLKLGVNIILMLFLNF